MPDAYEPIVSCLCSWLQTLMDMGCLQFLRVHNALGTTAMQFLDD